MSLNIRSFFSLHTVLLIVFSVALTFQFALPGTYPLEVSLIELILFSVLFLWALRSADVLASVRRLWKEDAFFRLLMIWAVWASLLWMVSQDWAYHINEVRWLYLSVFSYALFKHLVQRDFNRALRIFLGVSILTAILCCLQALTGFFTPPFSSLISKDVYTGIEESVDQAVAVGFFRHPNAFGGFIFWPLLIAVGMLPGKRNRAAAVGCLLLFGLSLYLSYYRTLILGLCLALLLFFLLRRRLSPRLLAALILGLCGLAVIASALALTLYPDLTFFNNLWARISYWQDCFRFIQQEPVILLFGSGFAPGAGLSTIQARYDPHNAYLYMLMHYGLGGLVLFVGMIGLVLRQGWTAYREGILQRQPVLGALYAGWIAWFLSDLIDSRLTTPEWQMLFVFLLALFLGGLSSTKTNTNTIGKASSG